MTDNNEEEEKELSNPKPKKLKGTSGFHLGNSYAEKAIKIYNFTNDSSTCIRCSKCKNSFSIKEYGDHRC
jgi:uncharacterized CHY-type Zn-finger protein